MNHRPPVLGILVGGASRRFPGGKLRAGLGSGTVLGTCLEALAPVADRLVLLGEPPASSPLPPGVLARGLDRLPDPEPGGGPLAGLAALAGVAPEGFLVSAGDMPFLPAPVLTELWRRSEGFDAASLALPDRRIPLPAALRPGAYPLLRELARRRPAPGPHRLLEALDAVRVPPEELGTDPGGLARWVADIDSPQDLESVQTRLG